MMYPALNTDQFVVPQVAPDLGGVDRFVGNVAALQDPAGTLERMQAEQIAAATADIKMEDIDAQYKGLALGAINEYQENRKRMYGANKGFNRLSLSAEQLLEDQKNYKGLLSNINTLRNVTNENRNTLDDVYKMFASQVITRDDYEAFEKARKEADQKATTIGDVPNYRAILNNYLQTKPQRYDPSKSTSPYKTPEQFAGVVLAPQKGRTALEYKDVDTKKQIDFLYDSPVWSQDIRPMMYHFGIFRQGMTPDQEYKAALDYSRGQFNDAEGKRGGGTTVNLPAWERNQKPKYRVTADKELYFTGKPTDGIVVTESIPAKVGRLEPGDLFIPKRTYIENGKRYVSAVTVTKGEFELGDGYVKTSTGAKYNPVVIELNDDAKDIIESNFFKFDASGNPDRSVWGQLNQLPAPPAKTNRPRKFVKELKGDEPPASLVRGWVYLLDDKYVKWDGTNLIEL